MRSAARESVLYKQRLSQKSELGLYIEVVGAFCAQLYARDVGAAWRLVGVAVLALRVSTSSELGAFSNLE